MKPHGRNKKGPLHPLRALRFKLEWTQQNVADECETVTHQTISDIEIHRITKPHDKTMREIANAFKVKATDIWPDKFVPVEIVTGVELRLTERGRR